MNKTNFSEKKNILLYGEKEALADFEIFFSQSFNHTVTMTHSRDGNDALNYLMNHNVNMVLIDSSISQSWGNRIPFFQACKTLYPELPVLVYYFYYGDNILSKIEGKYFERLEKASMEVDFIINNPEELFYPIVRKLSLSYSTEEINKKINTGSYETVLNAGKAHSYIDSLFGVEYLKEHNINDDEIKTILDNVADYLFSHNLISQAALPLSILQYNLDKE